MDQDTLVVSETFLIAHEQELELDLTRLVFLGRRLLFLSLGYLPGDRLLTEL